MSKDYNPIRYRKSRELSQALRDGDRERISEYSCYGHPNFETKCFLDCPLGRSCLRFKQDKVKVMRTERRWTELYNKAREESDIDD